MTHPCLASRKGETVEAYSRYCVVLPKVEQALAELGACAVRSCPVCLVFIVIGEADRPDLIAAGLIWGRWWSTCDCFPVTGGGEVRTGLAEISGLQSLSKTLFFFSEDVIH